MSAEEQLAAMDDEAFDSVEDAAYKRATEDRFRLLYEANLDAVELVALRRIEKTLRGLEEQLEAERAKTRRAVYLATHLMQMISPETWRDSGGDDGQGHYEGNYRAESIARELEALASSPASEPPSEVEKGMLGYIEDKQMRASP